jgi:alpha-1,2-mannosyltransferase
MGYSFALWLSKLLFPTVPTAAYVHYPTISTDMLQSLDSTSTEQGVNAGAGKGTFGVLKKKYWHFFAYLYSHVGGNIDVVMTNSSWTQSHIRSLWGSVRSKKNVGDITVVFPPVAVEELEIAIPVSKESETNRTSNLLYIAQFRPEKNHPLILQSFAKLLSSPSFSSLTSRRKPKLILVGSVRDDDDKKRVYNLRLLANELQIKSDVEFVCDASWPQVLGHLGSASVGVNGMWNEHFGIGVVEYQASGLISVVNDSGGPRGDIVVDVDGKPTGMFPCTCVLSFLTSPSSPMSFSDFSPQLT